MSQESMIATINSELKGADTETLGLLLEVLRKSKPGFSKPLQKLPDAMPHSSSQKTALSQRLKFIGENLLFEAIEKLSIKERGALQRSLKEQNKEWLREKFTDLNAFWVMVLDGQVKAWGKTMKDYPQPEQIMEICRSTGKYPFIFIDDDRMAIEEGSSVWHKLEEDDYAKVIYVEIAAVSPKARSFATTVYCVDDWQDSPFIKINPNRTALIGRNLPLDLELNILLQFGKRRTEIIIPASKRQKGKRRRS